MVKILIFSQWGIDRPPRYCIILEKFNKLTGQGKKRVILKFVELGSRKDAPLGCLKIFVVASYLIISGKKS